MLSYRMRGVGAVSAIALVAGYLVGARCPDRPVAAVLVDRRGRRRVCRPRGFNPGSLMSIAAVVGQLPVFYALDNSAQSYLTVCFTCG